MSKVALVTGHLGFIGRHITAQLLADGWEVSGLDIKSGQSGDCRRLFRESNYRYDLVIHCAAIVGGRITIDGLPLAVASDLAIDTDFFQFVGRTRPARAVYFSSSAAYPIDWQNPELYTGSQFMAMDGRAIIRLPEGLISPGYPREPDAIYGWVKLTGERVAAIVNGQSDNVYVLRPFSGYGSDQDLNYPFPSFIQRAVRGDRPFEVWGTGRQIRDWIHVDDIVELMFRALDHDSPRDLGPVNLCTGAGASMEELIRMCWAEAGHANRDLELKPYPDAPRGVMNRVGDPTKMIKALGEPRVTLEEGIARAVRVARHDLE